MRTAFLLLVLLLIVVIIYHHTFDLTQQIDPTSTLPIEFARTPIAQNSDWIPHEEEISGVIMMLVPVGCFQMGSEDIESAKPVHEICFNEPFWIDKYEVTNGQFAQFNGAAANQSNWTGDNRPREQITWFEARDFCEKRGARLPSEAEWEYAARGVDSLDYPWGNDFVAGNVVYYPNSGNQTADVGSKPDGKSWVGALDMSGNVSEWVNTLYNLYQYQLNDDDGSNDNLHGARVLRDGSWSFYDTVTLRAAFRLWSTPDDRNYGIGFRCARSE